MVRAFRRSADKQIVAHCGWAACSGGGQGAGHRNELVDARIHCARSDAVEDRVGRGVAAHDWSPWGTKAKLTNAGYVKIIHRRKLLILTPLFVNNAHS